MSTTQRCEPYLSLDLRDDLWLREILPREVWLPSHSLQILLAQRIVPPSVSVLLLHQKLPLRLLHLLLLCLLPNENVQLVTRATILLKSFLLEVREHGERGEHSLNISHSLTHQSPRSLLIRSFLPLSVSNGSILSLSPLEILDASDLFIPLSRPLLCPLPLEFLQLIRLRFQFSQFSLPLEFPLSLVSSVSCESLETDDSLTLLRDGV